MGEPEPDLTVLAHLQGYPDEVRRFSNLIKQSHPRGISAVEFLLRRPGAEQDFVYAVARLVRDGEDLINAVEAAALWAVSPRTFLTEIAAQDGFPPPLFRREHRAVWRRADLEAARRPRG